MADRKLAEALVVLNFRFNSGFTQAHLGDEASELHQNVLYGMILASDSLIHVYNG